MIILSTPLASITGQTKVAVKDIPALIAKMKAKATEADAIARSAKKKRVAWAVATGGVSLVSGKSKLEKSAEASAARYRHAAGELAKLLQAQRKNAVSASGGSASATPPGLRSGKTFARPVATSAGAPAPGTENTAVELPPETPFYQRPIVLGIFGVLIVAGGAAAYKYSRRRAG